MMWERGLTANRDSVHVVVVAVPIPVEIERPIGGHVVAAVWIGGITAGSGPSAAQRKHDSGCCALLHRLDEAVPIAVADVFENIVIVLAPCARSKRWCQT